MKFIGTEEFLNPIIEQINSWQSNNFVHPLTCGTDSQHSILKPKLKDLGDGNKQLVLYCEDCGYEQEHLPMIFKQI